MREWLHSLADSDVEGLVVLGPNPYGQPQDRLMLATFPLDAQTAAYAVANSPDLDADWPRTGPSLTSLQPLACALSGIDDAQDSPWRTQWLARGAHSVVRVGFSLPAGRSFECFLFTRRLLTEVGEAAALAWSALAIWPTLQAALVAAYSPLTPRELQCLVLAFDGLTARASAERMACTERTVNFHLANAMAKLKADNKVTAIQRACWLGAI